MCAKLARGTTLRPIVHTTPELSSPFDPNKWQNHPDRNWINELIMDIKHGVHIGFELSERTHYICENHLSTKTILEPVAKELDVQWWLTFLPNWNGCSFFHDDIWLQSPSIELFSDASKDAFGAYFAGDWVMGTFVSHKIPSSRSIAFKELYAIGTAMSAWAYQLSSKNILFHCDNMTFVRILSTGTSKCHHIMSLVQ